MPAPAKLCARRKARARGARLAQLFVGTAQGCETAGQPRCRSSAGEARPREPSCATCGAKLLKSKSKFCPACGRRVDADDAPSAPSAPPWTRGVGALRSALDAFERDERAMCRRGLWLEKGDVARKAVVKVFALGAGARVDGGQRTKSIASAIDAGDPHAVVDAVAALLRSRAPLIPSEKRASVISAATGATRPPAPRPSTRAGGAREPPPPGARAPRPAPRAARPAPAAERRVVARPRPDGRASSSAGAAPRAPTRRCGDRRVRRLCAS